MKGTDPKGTPGRAGSQTPAGLGGCTPLFACGCNQAAYLLQYLHASIGDYVLKTILRLLWRWKVAWHNKGENSSRVLERLQLSQRDRDLPFREKYSSWVQLL